ncbi:DUF4157 domain-containing protein [Rhodanobacter sp. AS-Z3]|uniref:eCIS core domain-containing protein n=1 Tax=Rhodanobacter sp. AS-Z3 TaxID=3031330 RepID=UPI0024784EE6|nr:DUF4157 domain-containing protein [Rhodanobacter sp. AS-Z3]WEN13760.1 DUF4157 domain-containing protein [Rhodanobacter sp. AS-Z3]
MTVGAPGDKFEQEADHTADKVLRMPDPGMAGKLQRAPGDKAQRQGAHRLQRQSVDKVQRRAEEKIFRTTADEGIQKAPEPRLQRREEEKILRVPAEQKVQRVEQNGIQRTEEKVAHPHRAEEKIFRSPDDTLRKKDEALIQKAATVPGGEHVQRAAAGGVPAVEDHVQSTIHRKMTGGQLLANDARGFMEPRFDADFSNVRVHHDGEAAGLNNRLGAKAFTYQNHIFFSRGQYQPGTSDGKQLLAHELTHTIQQGHAVQRSPEVAPVSAAPATPTVQRFGIQDALDKFADWAYAIPGYRLMTLVIGFNPINMRSADRSAANILRGLIELMPGGSLITQALDNHGVINKAATWVESKLKQLGDIGAGLKQALDDFLDSLSWTDIFDLSGVWARAKRIFTEPITQLIDFAVTTAVELLKMIKDAILKPLAVMAQGTRGYDLLCVLLGSDSITGEAKPPTADNLLGGFMKLIGQEEIWDNIKKGNAIARAFAWFRTALGGLMGIVRSIPTRIIETLTSLTITDVLTVVGAFGKIASCFISIASDFISWGMGTIWDLLKIIFDVVKPGLMGYITKTGAALKSILKNPIPFLRNLVSAAKLGFSNFAGHFGAHLKAGLIDWLTGSLTGVYIPKAATLPELGKFAMSVLGITWAQVRGKIVAALGPNGERIMQGLEQAFDVVKALVTGGVAAVWDLIKEKLSDLKDQVIGGIVSFVTDTIIKKAIPKLIGMFIPGAGFIPAIISIYDTIMVFVHKISKIIQVVKGFIDSIVTIAAGNIGGAAKRVESILAGLLSLSISFLAGFLGLSKVADKIMAVVQKVRAKVDAAIGAAVGWVVGKAKSMFARLFGGKDKPDDRTPSQKQADLDKAISEANALQTAPHATEQSIKKGLGAIKAKYKMKSLVLVVESTDDATEKVHVEGEINPKKQTPTSDTSTGGPVTPVPVNAWILNKGSGNRFEQVSASANLSVRVGGVLVPQTFMTDIPGGGSNKLAYSAEGTAWERTSFVHESKLVTPVGGGEFKLAPAVTGDNIRARFYQDSSSIHENVKRGRRSTLMHNGTHFLSEGDPKDEQRFGYKLEPTSGLALVPWTDSSADHQPPVAAHWTSGGNNQTRGSNTNQATRKMWTSSPSTYKIMSGSLNSSLNSRDAKYTQVVGINFRGPGERP